MASNLNLEENSANTSVRMSDSSNSNSSSFPENHIASSSFNNVSTGDSNACLITPSSIHISHMYVYNITPDLTRDSSFDSSIIEIPNKYQSPAASSGPICRICHEGDAKEDLVSPCRCTGTVGLVHKTCMERWLSTKYSTHDKCEICNYSFATIRSPKSFLDFIRSDENSANHRRSLMGDITCFFLLTPLAVVSSFLCIEGTKKQVLMDNSLEAGCLMALATFLITIFIVWNVLTLRFHVNSYCKWRSRNQNVKLIRVQRVSTSSDQNLHFIRVISPIPNSNASSNVSISIPAGSSTNRPSLHRSI